MYVSVCVWQFALHFMVCVHLSTVYYYLKGETQ